MATIPESMKAFLDAADRTALVEVARAKGSTPREAGAYMLVSPTAIHGTIGGGQLEFMAIDQARQMLADAKGPHELMLDIPLGPEIGQCCGGRVEVLIRLVDDELKAELLRNAEAEEDICRTSRSSAAAMSARRWLRRFRFCRCGRPSSRPGPMRSKACRQASQTKLTSVPEEMVRSAPAGAAFVVLTHDHALDFLIVSEALKRNDAAYVGMIGSKTKKATFRSWYLKSAGGSEADFARLVSPIGGDAVKDKRPAVIAALAAAEIMTALAACSNATSARVTAD